MERKYIELESTEAPYAWCAGTAAIIVLVIMGTAILALDVTLCLPPIRRNLRFIRKVSSVLPVDDPCTSTGSRECLGGTDLGDTDV